MKLKNAIKMLIPLALLIVGTHVAKADYKIIDDRGQISNQGTPSYLNGKQLLVIHSTATPNAPAVNISTYMRRTWSSNYSFTQWAVDDKEAHYIYNNGQVAWGAATANWYAYSQVEICEFGNSKQSKDSIWNGVLLARQIVAEAKVKGIQLEIVSHNWCTYNLGGTDHTDPVGFFSQNGYTFDWFKQQVLNTASKPPVVTPTKPTQPAKPVVQTPPATPNIGSLDSLTYADGKVKASGWHYCFGNIEYIFAMDANTGKEIARVKAPAVQRPDVAKVYGGDALSTGFSVSIPIPTGKNVKIMARTTNSADGNSAYRDLVFSKVINTSNKPVVQPKPQPVKPDPQTPAPKPVVKSAIDIFKSVGGKFQFVKSIRVDAIEKVNGIYQFINYDLAGGKDATFVNNGIPLDIVTNVTRGDVQPTQVGDYVKFYTGYDKGTIDIYDIASGGVAVNYKGYGDIWYSADALLNRF